MQEVFLEQTHRLERSSGFCQRRSRLSASAFVQGLVFGWLSSPKASVSTLASAMASAGAPVSPQAVQQRFNARSVTLLRQVLEAMIRHQFQQFFHSRENSNGMTSEQGKHPLNAFPRLWIRDSTIITLPLEMREIWPACGGATGPSAGLKISVLWDWHSGEIADLQITPASTHDHKVALTACGSGLSGDMQLFDLGYYSLQSMRNWQEQKDFFCCRYKAATTLTWLDEPKSKLKNKIDLLHQLDQLPTESSLFEFEVRLGSQGKKEKLPARLIARRVPTEIAAERQRTLQASCQRKRRSLSEYRLELCHWNLYLTNASESQLSPTQVEVLYRVRWQIERLFRLWKETLQIDSWRTQSPDRILCEIYAKLIGALLNQQLLADCVWSQPERSLLKATQTVSRYAMALLEALKYKSSLERTITSIQWACSKAAKIEKRRKRPSTCQEIEAAWNMLMRTPKCLA